MSGFEEFLARLAEVGVAPRAAVGGATLGSARRLILHSSDWGTVAREGAALGVRHAGVWADQIGDRIAVHACLAHGGDYLVCDTDVPVERPALASHAPNYPGVDRIERHQRDMYGIAFRDHPDPRRWIRHQAWPAGAFPLRHEFPVEGRGRHRAAADSDYPFVSVLGSGVYQIPVGPVHAGIIEPGHFRFHAVGEEVLALEERLGYVHKGIEKIAVGRDALGLARLAGRVSGDTTVAHAWAACTAMEQAAQVAVSPRALAIRALLAERERIANHLGDIGAICNDVAFIFAHLQCSRLREDWQRANREAFGHRLLMDCIVPGGIARDLAPASVELLWRQNAALAAELDTLLPILDDHPSLEDRLVGAGILSHEDARWLGVTGYVGKASGIDGDLRRDLRYPPYDRLRVTSPCLADGDVAARVQVRAEEIRGSLQLIDELFRTLPGGTVRAGWPARIEPAEGLGLVEGWRGEIMSFVRFGDDGRVARFFPRDPSWFSWPALERLIHGNIVPDFPVCNKSVNGSYSGHDL